MRAVFVAIFMLFGLTSLAQACPSWNYYGQSFAFSGAQLSQPRSFSVIAGGQNELRSCGFQNIGYVTTPPDFSFTLSGLSAPSVSFAVTSACDSVLLINAANASWFFDDDSNGNLDPRLTLSGTQNLGGRVDVWVGSYSGQYCNATLTLQGVGATPSAPGGYSTSGAAPGGYAPAAPSRPNQSGQSVGTLSPGASASTNCPSYAYTGTSYNFSGADLYSPRGFNVTAAGSANIARCPSVQPVNDRGPGFFSAAPAYSFNLSNMNQYRLIVDVVSQCDATMLINTGTGQWFYDDDDNGNLDPRIDLSNPPNGRLDVWVGTYNGGSCSARLNLQTFYR